MGKIKVQCVCVVVGGGLSGRVDYVDAVGEVCGCSR